MDKLMITIFTDPMMGLSYEMEPVFESLKEHYQEQLVLKYVMCGLVKDVSDFMTQEELSLDAGAGIKKYCERLAMIYKSEESIGGRLINMEGFHLFDEKHRSSYPLNIAFEAVKLIDESKAEDFLHKLAYATIVETKQTTRLNEILSVVDKVGIDRERFLDVYRNGMAEGAFLEDLKYRDSLGIHSLPAYLLNIKGKEVFVNGIIGLNEFRAIIEKYR